MNPNPGLLLVSYAVLVSLQSGARQSGTHPLNMLPELETHPEPCTRENVSHGEQG